MNNNDDLICFADQSEAKAEVKLEPWKVIITDDNAEIHQITKIALHNFVFENKNIEFLSAYSGQEAMALIKQNPDTALMLLDVVMEDEQAGMRVVQYIRETLKNSFVRIVLRTGQPGRAPEKEVIVNYDINDYKEKTELTANKLYTTLITSLRGYRDLIQLELAKSAAEQASRAKSSFLSTMNHELHTPLTAVLGYAEILKDESEEELEEASGSDKPCIEDRLSMLSKIVDTSKELGEILTDILDIANLHASQYEQDTSSFDIMPIFQKITQELTPLIQKNGNVLHFDDQIQLGHLTSDARKLQRIVRHLINNAAKFTKQGDIRLTFVRTQELFSFSVTDTGIGIAKDALDSIYHVFTQLDSSSTRLVDGRGIGLTIVKYFCQCIGGDVQVQSELGKGSTFTIQIPIT